MSSRVWRPWYYSIEAWHLHQRALQKGYFFHPTTNTVFPKIKLQQPLPHYLQNSWQRYILTPSSLPHYRHENYLLTQVDKQYYLLGKVQGEELHVQDFLLEEVAERWYQR